MANFIPDDYIDVQQRITRFWGEYPGGRIETDLMSPPDDFTQCRYVARVFRTQEDARPAATGWAFELAGGQGPNRTSHEENCETSAIGRALANLGYATRGSERPSRQEMQKAAHPVAPPQRERAPEPPPERDEPGGAGITQGQISKVWATAREKGIDNRAVHDMLLDQFEAASLKDLNPQQASLFIDRLVAVGRDGEAGNDGWTNR